MTDADGMERIKPSRKSRMKKRSADWEEMKIEVAKELGLWDTVLREGWSGLSAADSGRLGGVFHARRQAAEEQTRNMQGNAPEEKEEQA